MTWRRRGPWRAPAPTWLRWRPCGPSSGMTARHRRRSRRCWPAGRGGERSRRSSMSAARSTPGHGRSCPRLLNPAEIAAAARNTLNAHYTDASLVQAIWAGIGQLGFTAGRVLEPGCGSGNFIAFAPDGASITGVELEPVTAQIAAALYPDAEIINESFADTRGREAAFDLAIGNVPVRQGRPARPAVQPGRPQHPQPLHHQVPAPGPARRPGRRDHLPVHHGQPQPRGAPRDRGAGGPGRRGAAAQRRAPARGGHRGRHRPADLPAPRAGPPA